MHINEIKIDNQLFTLEEIKQKLRDNTLPIWEQKIYEFIIYWFEESDYILQKTSGSTGKPKMIKLNKSAMIASAQNTLDFFQLKKDDTAWMCLSTDYIAGKMMIIRALVGELNLIISDPSGTQVIPKQSINFAAMVPFQVQKLIETKGNFKNIKALIIGGASTEHNLRQAIQDIPTQIYTSYGMTETCSHIALQKINGSNTDNSFKTLHGITVSNNENNCLIIDAPSLLETAIQTTDIVELISPSKFKWKGRADNIINSGGIKINPEELEEEISQIIGEKCVVIPVKDQVLGEKMRLLVESETTNPTILSKIRTKIGRNRTPKSVVFIEKIPLNSSMKMDRKNLISTFGK